LDGPSEIQLSLGSGLNSPFGRVVLKTSATKLKSQADFLTTEGISPSLYHAARSMEGHALLEEAHKAVFRLLTEPGGAYYKKEDPHRVDEVKTALDTKLGNTLKAWSKRKSDDIYGLAWQLVAQLRSQKIRAARALHDIPDLRDYLLIAYDAITDVVARQLEQATQG
jgi:hypothetical protein